MKYILTLIFLIIISPFPHSLAQESDSKKMIEKNFAGGTVSEIRYELDRVVKKFEKAKLSKFENKEEIIELLHSNAEYTTETREATPFKEHSKDSIKNILLESFANNVFFQHLNNIDVSFISTADDEARYRIGRQFSYYHTGAYPYFTARKIYYNDGSTEDCNYPVMGEIPTGKLIDKINMDIGFSFFASVKKVDLTISAPEYTENDNFARLIDLDNSTAMLWISEKIYKKAKILVTLKSGEQAEITAFSKEIKRLSEKSLDASKSMITSMKDIAANIDANKYSDGEQITQDMLKRFPEAININGSEYALLINTKEKIDNVSLVLQEGEDSTSVNVTIPNADVMSKKLGFRTYRKAIIDDKANKILEIPFARIEHRRGPFLEVKETGNEKNYTIYQLDLDKKELIKTSYESVNGLGINNDFNYDYLLVKDTNTKKRGVTDLKGNIVLPLQYDDYIEYDPYDKLFLIDEGDDNNPANGVYNAQGKKILGEKYTTIRIGKCFIKAYDKDYKDYIFNKQGVSLLKSTWSLALSPPRMIPTISDMDRRHTSELDEPLLLVSEKTNTFFIDNKGQIILRENTQYKFHETFSDGMAMVVTRSANTKLSKYGFIDTTGKLIIPIVYEKAEPFFNGYAKVTQAGKTFYINKKNQIFEKRPESIDYEERQYENTTISIGL